MRRKLRRINAAIPEQIQWHQEPPMTHFTSRAIRDGHHHPHGQLAAPGDRHDDEVDEWVCLRFACNRRRRVDDGLLERRRKTWLARRMQSALAPWFYPPTPTWTSGGGV